MLKAERKDGDKLATKHQANAGSRLHVRPLYTAGDLMLALFELMDPRLFSSGYVQMVGDLPLRDTASSWSQEVNLFRVTYRVGKPNKWFHIRPSAKFDFHNQDLSAFLCPHLCPNAFTMTQIAASMETVEMKVWVSNFVRSYKTVHGLGSLEPACRSGNGIPKPCESMVGLTLDVQFIRHVEDAYLYSSQVRQQSKAEMRLQVSTANSFNRNMLRTELHSGAREVADF